MWVFNSEPVATNPEWNVEKDDQFNKQILSIVNVNLDFVGTIGCFLKSRDIQLYQEGSIQLVEAPGEEKMTAPKVQLDPDFPLHTILTTQPLNLTYEVTGTPDPSVTWLHNTTRFWHGTKSLSEINTSELAPVPRGRNKYMRNWYVQNMLTLSESKEQ